jgi:putative DNA primase/helicase
MRKNESTGIGRANLPPVASAEGQTDLANARRLVATHGNLIRYVSHWKSWICWDGKRWQRDAEGQVIVLAISIADANWNDAKGGGDAALRFAAKSASVSGIRAMVHLAQALVPITPDELDRDNWLFNCTNGTIDLRTGELCQHRPDNWITALCPTKYDRDAETHDWDRALEVIHGSDQTMIKFAQRFYGYGLTGSQREQCLMLAYGPRGNNGKSTELRCILETVGSDYAMQASPDLLMLDAKGKNQPSGIPDLAGKRLVFAIETEQNRAIAEALVKTLTGEDRIRSRRLYENLWEFSPQHKIILATNYLPRIKGRDNAIWRRFLVLPFDQRFWNASKGESGRADLKADAELRHKLLANREGILAWLTAGTREWLAHGLNPPKNVLSATSKYRTAQDAIGQFVKAYCVTGNGLKVRFADLFNQFERWAVETEGFKPSKKVLSSWLKENSFEEKHSGGCWYLGLGLMAEAGDGTMERSGLF